MNNVASYDICDKDGVSLGQLKDEAVRKRIYTELMGRKNEKGGYWFYERGGNIIADK